MAGAMAMSQVYFDQPVGAVGSRPLFLGLGGRRVKSSNFAKSLEAENEALKAFGFGDFLGLLFGLAKLDKDSPKQGSLVILNKHAIVGEHGSLPPRCLRGGCEYSPPPVTLQCLFVRQPWWVLEVLGRPQGCCALVMNCALPFALPN